VLVIADLRSSLAPAIRVSTILLLAACADAAAGPDPEPEPLDLGVRVVVDSSEFRSQGAFTLDLVPADRNGASFVTDEWTISAALSTPATVPLIPISQEVQPPDTQAVASAILIDNSGSMRFSDPDRQRASAAQLFWTDILAARPASVVALLDFGRGDAQPTPGFDRTVLLAGFTSDQGTLEAALDQIQAVPGGSTPLYSAATEVIDWMDTTTPGSAQRTLVVITDGEPSDGLFADSLFAVAAGRKVRIFAVGVGAAAENDPATTAATLTRELASRTGGIYGAAESPTELETILRTLAKSASPSRLLVHLRVDPAPASGTGIAGTVTVTGERGSATADWSFVAP
jgi:Mg-chelatase subunit ChlD